MLEDQDNVGATPFLLAVGSGKTEIVELLLSKKADVNVPNKQSVYPIHSAARTGDLETLKILVDVRFFYSITLKKVINTFFRFLAQGQVEHCKCPPADPTLPRRADQQSGNYRVPR